MKEKLIELMNEAEKICWEMDCTNCLYDDERSCGKKFTADHLIANGVVVRDKGEWDDTGRYQFMDGTKAIRCNKCGCALTVIEYQKYFYNFCPVCGADMRGEEHEET